MVKLNYVNELIEQTASFWSVRSGNSRMGVIAVGKNKICIFSPLAAVPAEAFGDYAVSHLLASNHYHNKALSSYVQHFPDAQICSSKDASPRLAEITGLTFKTLAAVSKKLPAGVEFIAPEGLKTGEVWIKFQIGRKCGWFVTDAFSGKKMSAKIHECDTPELLKTFPNYGIADKDVYKKWVLARIKTDKPTTIIPCHGGIIRNAKLPELLNKLMKNL